MTWDSFHRRGEVLRRVLEVLDQRRDGALPMELPGVRETFGDELALLGALQLRWHTRLAGSIERELMSLPMDLEAGVLAAWRATVDDLPGVRAVLDAYTAAPTSEEMARALDRAHRKDWTLMAAMAGRARADDPAAPDVGRTIEERARAGHRPAPQPPERPHPGRRRHRSGHAWGSLLGRGRPHVPA